MTEVLFCLPTECPLCGSPLSYDHIEDKGFTEFEKIIAYCIGMKTCPLSAMELTPMRAEAHGRDAIVYYRDKNHIWDSGHLESNV